MESLVLLDDFWEGMMILSEQDIAEISLSAVTVKDAVADARAVEAALLAKLASAELPEPALPTHAKGPMFTADQLHASLQSSRVAFEQVCKHRDALQGENERLTKELDAAQEEINCAESALEAFSCEFDAEVFNQGFDCLGDFVQALWKASNGQRDQLQAKLDAAHAVLDSDDSKIVRNAADGYPEGREPRELALSERVEALCTYATDWKRWCEEVQAKLDELQRQGPVAWRYVPSSVWGDFVLTDDPEKVQIASGYGAKVEPLYAAPKALEPLSEARVKEFYESLKDDKRSQNFTNENWFQCGIATAEAAYGITKGPST